MAISGRELEVDTQLAVNRLRGEGLSQRHIAERLGLCRRTVQKYLAAQRSSNENKPAIDL